MPQPIIILAEVTVLIGRGNVQWQWHQRLAHFCAGGLSDVIRDLCQCDLSRILGSSCPLEPAVVIAHGLKLVIKVFNTYERIWRRVIGWQLMRSFAYKTASFINGIKRPALQSDGNTPTAIERLANANRSINGEVACVVDSSNKTGRPSDGDDFSGGDEWLAQLRRQLWTPARSVMWNGIEDVKQLW
jgi:hypothetical protein